MPIIIDTSVWVSLFKDKTGRLTQLVASRAQSAKIVMVLPVRLEILQGCRGEVQWQSMLVRLNAFERLTMTAQTWDSAARLYYEMRQTGKTIRSSLDCCIAQLAIENDCTLFHNDRDFETIAAIRPLKHQRLDLDTPAS